MNKDILKKYFVHFLLAVFSLLLFMFGISAYLDNYTRHNEYISTPNVIDLPLKEGIQILQNKKLRYSILDSTYNPDKKPGHIINQNPEPNTKVKENRNVYLSITSFLPPSIEMPKLVDLSERQAIMVLKSYDLKLGKIIYEPSYCNGCVVKQLYKNKEILPGKYIPKNSVIDIVVGKKETKVLLPNDTINDTTSSLDNE